MFKKLFNKFKNIIKTKVQKSFEKEIKDLEKERNLIIANEILEKLYEKLPKTVKTKKDEDSILEALEYLNSEMQTNRISSLSVLDQESLTRLTNIFKGYADGYNTYKSTIITKLMEYIEANNTALSQNTINATGQFALLELDKSRRLFRLLLQMADLVNVIKEGKNTNGK